MDLYIQIGVLLLILSAFALFAYIFTAPAQQFTQGINETNQTVMDRLETSENLDLAPFLNNPSMPGTAIYPIIRDAEASKIGVILHTKNQQGLVVNYGYQIRPANFASTYMIPHATAGVGNPTGTDFEKSFVTSASEIFGGGTPVSISSPTLATTPTRFGNTAFPTNIDSIIDKTGAMSIANPLGSLLASPDPATQTYGTPHLMFADPTNTWDDARKNGRTFAASGVLYTDQVLKLDAPVNNNFSYADASGSLYRFDKNASYYTTLIMDANQDIIGIYIEQHGINHAASALGQAMLANGTITQLY